MNAPIDLRLPPHSIEAEQSLIGGLLLDNAAWDRIADIVADADFFRDDHRRIFRHIRRLIESGKPADVVTAFDSIASAHEVDQTGGMGYLGEIANATPSAANIRRYAEIVRERAVLRSLISVADAIRDDAMGVGATHPEKIARRAELALSLAIDRATEDPVTASQAMADALVAADEHQRAGRSAGIETGIAGLDRLTGGLLPGQLVVIAARPSVGKTAFALGIADHVAVSGGRVAFFSLEMTRAELAARLLAMRSGVPIKALRSGPDERQWASLTDASSGDTASRIIFDDRPAASLAYVRARSRRLHRQGALALIAVYYLQLMTAADHRASRNEQVGSLSRGLKSLAKELGVPVICLAQLNRAVESRVDRRPQLSDLRDSGEVEQDADIVALLSRVAEPSEHESALIEGRLAKHRNGPTGETLLAFDAEKMRFLPYAGPRPAPARAARRGFEE